MRVFSGDLNNMSKLIWTVNSIAFEPSTKKAQEPNTIQMLGTSRTSASTDCLQ